MAGDDEVEDDISQAFKVFDKDGDGLITAEEIQETMMGLGEDVSEAEVKAMVLEADLNGDGFIDFTEFSNLMKNNFGGLHGSRLSLKNDVAEFNEVIKMNRTEVILVRH